MKHSLFSIKFCRLVYVNICIYAQEDRLELKQDFSGFLRLISTIQIEIDATPNSKNIINLHEGKIAEVARQTIACTGKLLWHAFVVHTPNLITLVLWWYPLYPRKFWNNVKIFWMLSFVAVRYMLYPVFYQYFKA